MAPHKFLRLLIISLFVAVATVSARHSPGIHNQQTHNGVPQTHITNKMVVRNDHGNSDSLNKICSKTDHPALCIATVSRFLEGKPTVDNTFTASVEAASSFGHHALREVKKMAQRSSPGMRSTYQDCIDFYQTALDSFHKTLEAESGHDLGTMKTQLSSAITWIETCNDEFAESSGGPSPLESISNKWQSMASDSLAIVDQM